MSEQIVIQGEMIKKIYISNKKYSIPFSVFKIKIHTCSSLFDIDEITVQCNAPLPELNKHYNFYGKLVENEKYGLQFKAEYYVRELPATIEDTVAFLGSGIIKGVGPKKAERIVNALGENCILEIIKEPSILNKIKGLNSINVELVAEKLIEHFALHRFSTFFKSIKIKHSLGLKILRVLGDNTIEIIKENPYILISLIDGIGLKRADQIAKSLDITGNHPKRIKGLITAMLYKLFEKDGSSYTNRKFLFIRLNKELENMNEPHIKFEDFDLCVSEMIKEKTHNDFGTIVEIGYRISLLSIIKQEMEISDLLVSKSNQNLKSTINIDWEKINSYINRIENQFKKEITPNFTFSKSQREALLLLNSVKIFAITGGAGSGKSTVINALVRLYSYCNGIQTTEDLLKRIILLAPTGKAAKRLTEITNINASTIHRFIHNNMINLPEEPCLFVVDETSMIELNTAHKLLKSIREQDTILFIGDPMQLPAVGSGRFFHDILESKLLPIIHLNKIYRQSSNSNILKLANIIRNDEIHNVDQYMIKLNDMNFFDIGNYQLIYQNLIHSFKVAHKKGIDIQDIQILSPIKNGYFGVKALNNLIQDALIKGELNQFNQSAYKPTSFRNTDYSFCIGDRIIQLKNNKEKQIFNGDMGVIVGTWKNKETNEDGLLVQFENITLKYTADDLEELALAYCLTIHKAQGSEYKYVILILVSDNFRVINKNLIYTALTRAKQSFIFFGDKDKFKNGLYRKPIYRCTSLKYLLKLHNYENNVFHNNTLNQYRNLLKKETADAQQKFDFTLS